MLRGSARVTQGASHDGTPEKAIGEARKLPNSQQDAIAAIILEELADKRRWDKAFAASQDVLSRMKAEVRRVIVEGRVRGGLSGSDALIL